MSGTAFSRKASASAPEAVQLWRVTVRMGADARLFLAQRPPIAVDRVRAPVAHIGAPNGQSVLAYAAVDRPQVGFERPALVQRPLPLVLDRAATTPTTNCGSHGDPG